MKAGVIARSILLITLALSATFSWFVQSPKATYASIAPFEAKDFCKRTDTNCVKENKTGRSGSISCPEDQIIENIYVHAGDGQTVYQLPHEGFDYEFSDEENTVTVTVTTHEHDLSWLGVTCIDSENTPTPTSSDETPTPTPTDEQNETPTPTPTDEECDPNSQTCIIIDCDGGGECSVEINQSPTPTKTPTATPTATNTPTATPTQAASSTNGTSSDSNGGTGGSTGSVLAISTKGEVLGASTLGETGTFIVNLMNSVFALGTSLLVTSGGMYVRQKKNT